MVWIWTGAETPTLMNPGCSTRFAVRYTGASVSPCLFVQPAVDRTRAATTARRPLTENRSTVFIESTFSLLEDPGGDEDQQLVVLFGAGLVAEEVSEDGNLPEARDHVVLVLVVDLEDP